MGKAVNTQPGNRVLVGTDPVLHSGGVGDRAKVISDGIDFAGAQPGRTGLYFDTTCGGNYLGQTGLAASMMGQLSSGSGTWTEDDTPPCGGNVAKIASTPKFDSLTTADLAGWSCSVHESFPTFASDWTPLAVATDTTSHPTCGTDTTVTPPVDACGEAYVLIAGSGIVVVAPDIALAPATGSDPAGGSHTLMATVTQAGSAVAGQLVTFTVTGQNNGVTGTCSPATCLTDGNGHVSFTYNDANGVGTDTILAAFTTGGSTQQTSATQTWTAAVNHAPVAANQSVTTPQGTPVAVTLSATDADSNPLTYAVVTGPAHGTLSGTAPGLTYTPNAGYSGPDSFTFKANDGSADSNTATVSITVTPVSTGCTTGTPSVDMSVSADQRAAGDKVTSAKLTTAGGNELVLAFVGVDGPRAPTQRVTSLTGGGLTWTLAARSNKTWGTAEVWQAYATAPLTDMTVTAKYANTGYDATITVTAFRGAANHLGATAIGAGLKGAPSAKITPSGCNGLLWATGHDWTHNTAAKALPGQSLIHQFDDTRVHDWYWTEQVDAPTSAGTAVSVGVTGPTTDRWTMAAVEVPGA
jgi:hypothetical protein